MPFECRSQGDDRHVTIGVRRYLRFQQLVSGSGQISERQISAQRPSLPLPSELASARLKGEIGVLREVSQDLACLRPGRKRNHRSRRNRVFRRSKQQRCVATSSSRRCRALQRSFRFRHLPARRTLAMLSRRPQLKPTGAEQLYRALEPGSLSRQRHRRRFGLCPCLVLAPSQASKAARQEMRQMAATFSTRRLRLRASGTPSGVKFLDASRCFLQRRPAQTSALENYG